MRPDHGAVEHLNQMRRRAHLRQGLEERIEYAGPAQPPEALPDTVPVAELRRQRAPGNIVDREVVQRFQELAVVPSLIASPRAGSSEDPQYHRPVPLQRESSGAFTL